MLVDDLPIDKAGASVRQESRVRLKGELLRFVSRGGEKLEGALEELAIDVTGLYCLDVGASTGGFSDCLLQRGATGVAAVDVGRGQLHEKLRQDPRVQNLERTHARDLEAASLAEPVGLVVVDVSFISARQLLPNLALVAAGAPLLVMVKPQFEVGREQVGKGGVVRDDALRGQAVDAVAAAASEHGYREAGRCESRLRGPKGNREVFLLLERQDAGKRQPPEAGV